MEIFTFCDSVVVYIDCVCHKVAKNMGFEMPEIKADFVSYHCLKDPQIDIVISSA